MTDAWDERRRAQEEQYFQKMNEDAIKRLKVREGEKPRISPITGKPLKQINMMGIVVDQCEDSGGIWLDKGELEALIEAFKNQSQSGGIFSSFLSGLTGKK